MYSMGEPLFVGLRAIDANCSLDNAIDALGTLP